MMRVLPSLNPTPPRALAASTKQFGSANVRAESCRVHEQKFTRFLVLALALLASSLAALSADDHGTINRHLTAGEP